jgi:hypothetical protein
MLTDDVKMPLEWKSCDLAENSEWLHSSNSQRISVSMLMGVLKGKTDIELFKKLPTVEEETAFGQSFLVKRILR